ncbi:MAG: SIR2 family protein [Proteobacteria bacterium]|nr:MAG: SIR2 family protein [Pseudomonadota bacterium]
MDELSCLGSVAKRSVAGVITTNYDGLMEEVFKGYAAFVGQEQLLFGQTQGVAEIYKIHGCCSQPDSIVINQVDYEAFEKRNAYLAAKLLTIFVEHPIVFLGYSISDPNVVAILRAIIDCLSQKNLHVLKQRLIFVEYSPTYLEEPIIAEHSLAIDGGTRSIKMTKITLSDFLPLFSEIHALKFHYNPKLLRQLKRDIYKMVTTNEPVDHFKITDIENDEDLEKVEVLAGVGVVIETGGDRGHHIPEAGELFCDLVFDDKNFNVKSLVENALSKLQRSYSHSLPIHKYVAAYRRELGEEPPPAVLADCKTSIDGFLSQALRIARRESPIASIEDLNREAPSDEKWLEMFPRLAHPEKVLEPIREFLANFITNNPRVFQEDKTVKTTLKRVIRIYDWLKYGQEKNAPTP